MNQQEIREELLEPLLAEVNSDFYTDAILNYAISHSYRIFCRDTGGGPVASFEETGDGTTRSWQLPAELVDIRRVDYDTTQDEIPFLPFEHFSLRFGDNWIANTATGRPDAYAVMGSHSVIFKPIPAVKVFKLYGPIIPDALASDSTELLVTEGDAYTISDMAYVRLVERHGSRTGQLPPNYDRGKAAAENGLRKAIGRIHKMHGGPRVAGRLSSFVRLSPTPNWDTA